MPRVGVVVPPSVARDEGTSFTDLVEEAQRGLASSGELSDARIPNQLRDIRRNAPGFTLLRLVA